MIVYIGGRSIHRPFQDFESLPLGMLASWQTLQILEGSKNKLVFYIFIYEASKINIKNLKHLLTYVIIDRFNTTQDFKDFHIDIISNHFQPIILQVLTYIKMPIFLWVLLYKR
jgi:hypothetical protein